MSDNKTMKEEYGAAMKSATAMAFIQVIDRHPTATLMEVAALAKDAGIGDIPVGQLFAENRMMTGAEWAEFAGEQKALTGDPGINTRTPAGRDEFDTAILRVLKSRPSAWLRAPAIRAVVGGTPLQVRTALNRLVSDSYAQYKGIARATAYQVAS